MEYDVLLDSMMLMSMCMYIVRGYVIWSMPYNIYIYICICIMMNGV